MKWAFNAAFEHIFLSTWLARQHPELMAGRRFLDPAQWRCTMVWSAYLGLPMSLDLVATVLDLPVRKDSAGKKLIRQFCTPAKPSVFNQGGMRKPPASDSARCSWITRSSATGSTALALRLWNALQSLTKDEASAVLDTYKGEVREVLQLRGELTKSSVTKYKVMQHAAGRDGRGRGFLQFYGAGRTGRFAGRLVQVQNLPRNYLPDLSEARGLVRTSNVEEAVELSMTLCLAPSAN
ncbi:hypothetical protein QP942_03215 [Corynebacterium pseudodiphtheriticum]|nr:hypothetical protein [Corynebacterium pseudodiphtheriticum]